jgi:hypothetical protein
MIIPSVAYATTIAPNLPYPVLVVGMAGDYPYTPAVVLNENELLMMCRDIMSRAAFAHIVITDPYGDTVTLKDSQP